MGRTRTTQPRLQPINIRVTDWEKDLLIKAATKLNITQAEFVRRAIEKLANETLQQ